MECTFLLHIALHHIIFPGGYTVSYVNIDQQRIQLSTKLVCYAPWLVRSIIRTAWYIKIQSRLKL